MGLFKSKKTRVYSMAMHLMEMNPDADKDAVLYAVLKHQSIPRTLINSRLSGLNIKTNAARNYAKDNYVLGLPTDLKSTSGVVDDTIVAAAITEDLSLPFGCLVIAHYVTRITAYSLVMPFLLDSRGIDTDTGAIFIIPPAWAATTPATYLTSPVIADYYVSEATLNDVDGSIQIDYKLKCTYNNFTNDDGDRFFAAVPEELYEPEFSEIVDGPTGIIEGSEYCVAVYKEKTDAQGTVSSDRDTWYYNMRTGTHPELNPDHSILEEVNTYPVVPIRYENAFISSSNEPEIYDTGSQILRRMGLDFDTLVSKMAENTEGIEEIDHAYVMFGVDLNTSESIPLKYLAEFFTYLLESSNISLWDRLNGIAVGNMSQEKINYFSFSRGGYNSIGKTLDTSDRIIDDGSADPATTTTTVINPTDAMTLTEHGFNVDITYDFVTSVIHEGVIGDIGFAQKTIQVIDIRTITDLNRRLMPPEGIKDDASPEEIVLTDAEIAFTERLLSLSGGEYLIIQEQLEPNTYREVTIKGLTHTNHVYRKKTVVTTPKDLIDEPDEHNLIIPLHHNIVRRLDSFDQSRLYEYSAILVMNSYVVTKLKWYQTGIFKGIIAIIGIIITVWTGQGWVLSLITAMEAGAAALFMFVLQTVINTQLLMLGAQLLIELVGPELGMVIGVVLFALSKGKTWATLSETFLQVGLTTMKAAGDSYQDMITAVADEYDDWLIESEEQKKELEDARDLLHPEYMLPISLLLPSFERPIPDVESKPSEFYNSTHIGNVGTLALDVIENFVDISLLLPEGGYA